MPSLHPNFAGLLPPMMKVTWYLFIVFWFSQKKNFAAKATMECLDFSASAVIQQLELGHAAEAMLVPGGFGFGFKGTPFIFLALMVVPWWCSATEAPFFSHMLHNNHAFDFLLYYMQVSVCLRVLR